MKELPITEFMKGRRQYEVAAELGMTQSAISQLLRSGREVIVRIDKKGKIINAYERRYLGAFAEAEETAPAA